MSSTKKFTLYFIAVLILSAIFLSTCSETSEYGEASDYEKLGASCTNSSGDTSAPTISELIPSDNSTNVPIANKIVVTFSDAMLAYSVTTNTADTKCSGSLQLSSDNFTTCIKMSGSPEASDNDTTFTVTPASSLSLQTNYKLKITTSVVENSCNKLATDNTTSNGFTTAGPGSGTIQGSVIIASNGNALSGVNVQFYGTTIDNTTTDSDGEYDAEVDVGDYTISYSKSGYLDVVQDVPLETDNQTLEVETITMYPTADCVSGSISGTIRDYRGDNVSGVYLQIRKNYNQAWKPVLATTTTDSSGYYSFSSMDVDPYTIYTSKSGYINGAFTVYSCSNVAKNYPISPTLPNSNSMRIILGWPTGRTGEDLDSHFQIPDNSSNAWGLHWARNIGQCYDAGCDYYRYSPTDNVTLDIDEQQAGGMETITVITAQSGFTYSHSVHDWSNKADNNSTDLSKSGATVTVYLGSSLPGSGLPTVYTVPSRSNGGIGNLWRVFTFTKSGGLTKSHELTNVVTSNPGASYDDVY